MKVYTVSQINNYIKRILENDVLLSDVYIEAEISNFKAHTSGHLYFTLKDSGAAINAVMFRSYAERLKFMPESGMKVVARGYISLYEKTGQYQLYVNSMEPAGIGALYLAYEQLKARLEKAGVFDQKYKKPIPQMPKTVAVITSPTGAAVRDIINVAGRRNPNVEIVIVPTLVQGKNAGPEIVNAIEKVNRWNKADTIILGRGGGSIEDLWAFNEEIVARAIFDSHIPIISAVGHETDFTIADFISDMRAPTPSAGAEIAVPEGNAINEKVVNLYEKITNNIQTRYSNNLSKYKYCINSYGFKNFSNTIFDNEIYVSELFNKIYNNLDGSIKRNKLMLKNCLDNIENKSPLNILKRGYSLAYNNNGELLKSSKNVSCGDKISVRLNEGSVEAVVESVNDN
ncbi:MAG: exodeoxyribonuclease VII large subunit [Lachnospirales bacterium]